MHAGRRDGIRAARPASFVRSPLTSSQAGAPLGSLRTRAPAYGLNDFYVLETRFRLRRAQQIRISKD
jgi:hypothetical protein